MKKYYYTDRKEKFGPFTKEELIEKNISRGTLVWTSELSVWKPAGNIPELAEMLPPPIPEGSDFSNDADISRDKYYMQPHSWLTESILVTLFCCLPFGIAGIVNAAKVKSYFNAGQIEEAKHSSKQAKKWTAIGFWIGIVFSVLYLLTLTV